MTKRPPFITGQLVQALYSLIITGTTIEVKKGQEFTVTSVRRGCCGWLITVGIKSPIKSYLCNHCKEIRNVLGEVEFDVDEFIAATDCFEEVDNYIILAETNLTDTLGKVEELRLCYN